MEKANSWLNFVPVNKLMKRDSDLSNIIGCLYSEMETLGLKPRLISSVMFPLCLGLKFISTIDLSILTI